MYSIPRPLCNSVTTFLPHNKPFSTTLALASKSVSQLQRRALKLPASTGISTDYTASKEEAAPKENAVPNSKLSTPTASSTLGSFNLARSKVLSKENDHDHDAYDLIRPLLKENGGKWLLTADKKGIERVFRFRGFKAAWTFMKAIAPKCREERHHPEWVNIYNTVFIRWTTHQPRGLSTTDILMAKFCDAVATASHEKIPDPSDGKQPRNLTRQAQTLKLFSYASSCMGKGEEGGGWGGEEQSKLD